MSESPTEVPVVEIPATKPRFNVRKILKTVALALTGVGLVFLVARKLSTSVDGEVTATVTTNDEG